MKNKGRRRRRMVRHRTCRESTRQDTSQMSIQTHWHVWNSWMQLGNRELSSGAVRDMKKERKTKKKKNGEASNVSGICYERTPDMYVCVHTRKKRSHLLAHKKIHTYICMCVCMYNVMYVYILESRVMCNESPFNSFIFSFSLSLSLSHWVSKACLEEEQRRRRRTEKKKNRAPD